MHTNPPDLRPDLARARIPDDSLGARRDGQPTIGMVSLGCPKALVDSERILTRLRAEGYAISPDYKGADAVIVNTCGFLDSAKAESLDAIGDALRENGKVLVTGCLGAEPDYITGAHPKVLAITGPHQYEAVLDAVHAAVPPQPDPFIDLLPASGVSLTPRHYSYLKISEGCNHRCKFCIIPNMRGKLVSRPAHAVVREAEKLVQAGVRELLVISQDTSAYGLDRRFETERGHRAHITDLARDLGSLGAWVRLHYVYPYPYVRDLIPLMAEGLVLPYLDIPFQHAHPDTLRRMARPAAAARTLDEIAAWRAICPEIVLRSTFIVGYPGETEADHDALLQFVEEAQLDWCGFFRYSPEDHRYDHHQPDRPQRPDGLAYSSFGLVWRHFGLDYVAGTLSPGETASPETLEEVHALSASYRAMVMGEAPPAPALGDLVALAGVSRLHARRKCALLAWNALEAVLKEAESA